jgi:hypothetical protein
VTRRDDYGRTDEELPDTVSGRIELRAEDLLEQMSDLVTDLRILRDIEAKVRGGQPLRKLDREYLRSNHLHVSAHRFTTVQNEK